MKVNVLPVFFQPLSNIFNEIIIAVSLKRNCKLSKHIVVCHAAKFRCARHCVIYNNNFLAIFSTNFDQNHDLVLLPYEKNLKGIGTAFPETCGFKYHPNFFVFFFFTALINPFKTNFPYFKYYQISTNNLKFG